MKTIDKALKILNKKYNISNVDVAIVAGSGLADSSPDLEGKVTVNYDCLGLPKSKVKGHSGAFTFGKFNGKVVAIVSRMHYYESGDIAKVRLPLEIMAKLGCKKVILLTSCGGVNSAYNVGDVMLIKDQINMSGINPLIGMEEIKFVNMSDCYNQALRDKIKKIAKKNKIDLKEGIFCQMSGPSYETRAEIEMLRGNRVDAVSMSTAHDCIIANYYDMKVAGFSAIVNVFTDNANQNLSHKEVLDNAKLINKNLKTILSEII